MQVTQRDVEILRFINEFGFCVMPQIEIRFGMRGRRSYQVMEKLVKAGLVYHERIFYGKHGVFYLTDKGANFTDLPSIEKISLGIYEHQMVLTNVYLKLRQHYPDMEWISERQLIQAV